MTTRTAVLGLALALPASLLVQSGTAQAACLSRSTARADLVTVQLPAAVPVAPVGVTSSSVDQSGRGTQAATGEGDATAVPLLGLGTLTAHAVSTRADATVSPSLTSSSASAQVTDATLVITAPGGPSLTVALTALRTTAATTAAPTGTATATAESVSVNGQSLPATAQTITVPGIGTVSLFTTSTSTSPAAASAAIVQVTLLASLGGGSIVVGRSTSSTTAGLCL